MNFWILINRSVNRLSVPLKGSVPTLVTASQKRYDVGIENIRLYFQVPTGAKLNIVIALQTLVLCWAHATVLNLF